MRRSRLVVIVAALLVAVEGYGVRSRRGRSRRCRLRLRRRLARRRRALAFPGRRRRLPRGRRCLGCRSCFGCCGCSGCSAGVGSSDGGSALLLHFLGGSSLEDEAHAAVLCAAVDCRRQQLGCARVVGRAAAAACSVAAIVAVALLFLFSISAKRRVGMMPAALSSATKAVESIASSSSPASCSATSSVKASAAMTVLTVGSLRASVCPRRHSSVLVGGRPGGASSSGSTMLPLSSTICASRK